MTPDSQPLSSSGALRAAVVWECFGPYHRARVAALRKAWTGATVRGVQLVDQNRTYAWAAEGPDGVERDALFTLFPGRGAGEISVAGVFRGFRNFLRCEKITVAFLPSYWPAASAALLLAARSCGVRTVMMNDSHAGTEAATGLKRLAKKCLVRLFHSGLVAGAPQLRHFAALGLPESRLFTGYDAVDNDYFARAAAAARTDAGVLRKKHGLPSRYVLSLGRMVPKKNLAVLLRAFAALVEKSHGTAGEQAGGVLSVTCPGLVLVGSGDEEPELRRLAAELSLPVIDRTRGPVSDASGPDSPAPGVYFLGFRQIEENPIFYALADVFVLPSMREEWGLVVNEAMACGLPVIVSGAAGCAGDLVEESANGFTFDPDDPADLAAKLQEILRDPARAAAMGRRSAGIIANWGCDNFARQAIRAAEAAQSA